MRASLDGRLKHCSIGEEKLDYDREHIDLRSALNPGWLLGQLT